MRTLYKKYYIGTYYTIIYTYRYMYSGYYDFWLPCTRNPSTKSRLGVFFPIFIAACVPTKAPIYILISRLFNVVKTSSYIHL